MVEGTRRPDLLAQRMLTLRECDAAGKWQDAIGLSSIILKQLSRRKETSEILTQTVDVLNTRGKVLRCDTKQHLAIPCFEKALVLAEKTGDQEQQLMSTSNLIDGWRTYHRGIKPSYPADVKTDEQRKVYGLQKAISHADQAQELIRQMPPGFSEARGNAYNQFGLIYTAPEVADPQKAFDSYILAEEGFRPGLIDDPNNAGLQERLARTIHLKGAALEQLGRLPEAEIAQRDALDRSIKMEHAQNIGNAANSLGDIKMKLGDSQEAFKCFQLAYEISKKDGNVISPEIRRDAMIRLAQFKTPPIQQ